MTRAYVALATAWEFLTGLRISTHRAREHQQSVEDGLVRHIHAAERTAKAQAAEKREAQRILAILSEPLKDWELADFPDPGYLRRRSEQTGHTTPLSHLDVAHLANVLEAYRIVAREAAQARMSVTTNDMLRGRTWGDQRRGKTAAQEAARPVRNLP